MSCKLTQRFVPGYIDGELDLARTIEAATDRLAGFGHLLRARVLADLAT